MTVVSGNELWQWRRVARQNAAAAGVPPEEVDWLLREVAGLDKLVLRWESFKERSRIQLKKPLSELSQLWQRRLEERFPVQYVAGVAPWRNFSLAVTQSVLIPRPETEYLIELSVEACRDRIDSVSPPLQEGHWADLGTGSGAIALGLAEAFKGATIHATDCSAEAIAIARQNARRYPHANQIEFYLGSWFEPLSAWGGQLSGVVANPPYIPSAMVPQLQPEVSRHEPHLALDGGPDGLDCIRHIINTAPFYLRSGGVLLLEMMAGQAPSVRDLLHCQGSLNPIKICSDLAGIQRFAVAYRC